MKKSFLAWIAALLFVSLSVSGKTPDDLLKEKVPDSADSITLIDARLLARTAYFQEARERITAKMKKGFLPEEILRCRVLVFCSSSGKWIGIMTQSENGEAKAVFDYQSGIVAGMRNKADCTGEVEFSEDGRSFTVRSRGKIKKDSLTKLCSDNLMLTAIGKTDPDFFKGGNNELLGKIEMQGMILSSAGNVRLPDGGLEKKCAEHIFRTVPALRKLESFTLNIPFAEADQTLDLRMTFPDDKAAEEMLASVNGFFGKSAGNEGMQKIDRALVRSTEKNVLRISLKSLRPVLDQLRKVEKKAEEDRKKNEARLGRLHGLKYLGVALTLYEDEHKHYPASLTELTEYLSEFCSAKEGSSPEMVRYAYVGGGLTSNAGSDMPLAFEKPSAFGKDGLCGVVYVDGHVSWKKVRGRTCREIAAELTAEASGNDGDKAAIIANAETIDREK